MTEVATFFLNYPGKVDNIGQVVGPNWFGEVFTIVENTYDPETKTTRAGLAISHRMGD